MNANSHAWMTNPYGWLGVMNNELWKVLLWEGVTNVVMEVRDILCKPWHDKVLTVPGDMNCHCNTTNNTTILHTRNETPEVAFCFSQ